MSEKQDLEGFQMRTDRWEMLLLRKRFVVANPAEPFSGHRRDAEKFVMCAHAYKEVTPRQTRRRDRMNLERPCLSGPRTAQSLPAQHPLR